MSAELLVVGSGALAAQLYVAWQPDPMMGIRRQPRPMPFPVLAGDAASEDLWTAPQLQRPFTHILVTATPGLRGGGPGNGLVRVMEQVVRRWPAARLVYTASTAVYGDSGGAEVDDHTPPTDAGRAPDLLAIEAAARRNNQALVLRVGAIVGPRRLPRRLHQRPLVISGDPQRPFPFIHEQNLVAILAACLRDASLTGVCNCVAPQALTYRDYYAGHLQAAGIDPNEIAICGDAQQMPARQITAPRLWDYVKQSTELKAMNWHLPWQDG